MRAVLAALPRFRALAESRMISTCAVMRKTGDTTTGANGLEVPEWATVYASVPCRVAGRSGGAAPSRTTLVGGAEFETASRELHLPSTTTGLRDGDLVEITSGDCDGLVVRLLDVETADQVTARRLRVEETRRPEEWAA